MVEKEYTKPSDVSLRKPLTEEQTRVVNRMLAGQSLWEAAEAEGIEDWKLSQWNRLGCVFEEVSREKLLARWASCQTMTMRLVWQSLNRLAKIIESGTDADAIRASGAVLKLKAMIAPNGFKLWLTPDEHQKQLRFRDVLGDYYEETPEEEEMVVKRAGAYAGSLYPKKRRNE
jgi:hypothetical protein